jgi:uncharacterized iron-regulated membrane protein
MSFFHRPQAVWWRKALFQVHLWVGIFVALYAVIIGLTGSVLVFKDELAEWSYPHLMESQNGASGDQLDLAAVGARAQAAYPKYELGGIYLPGVGSGNILVFLEGKPERPGAQEPYLYVMADAADGRLLGALDVNSTWLYWIGQLHYNLLLDVPGYVANAIGAALLLILTLSGIVLWWPGIRRWATGFLVDFRRGWKRMNFDLHNAVGFYTLLFVAMWSVSGINFIFPKQVAAVVDVFSPSEAGRSPEIKVQSKIRNASISAVLAEARRALPGNALAGIYLGEGDAPFAVFMARGERGDFSRMDYIYFDPASGKQLALWRGGANPTWGSALVYWLSPLHFGTYWGLPVKILWSVLGLSLPLLAITGCLMYWNRYLSKKWRRLQNAKVSAPREEVASAGIAAGHV